MRKWDNLKGFHGCLTVFAISCIIGISFGFAKYYDVPVLLTGAFVLASALRISPQLIWV